MKLDYLFLDASFFRMHPGSPAEPVLAAWGITTGGKPAFIGLAPGTGESADAWHDFLAGRGLASQLLIISDGAPGLITAVEQIAAARLNSIVDIPRLPVVTDVGGSLGRLLSEPDPCDRRRSPAPCWISGATAGDTQLAIGPEMCPARCEPCRARPQR